MPDRRGQCWGVAFAVPEADLDAVLSALDVRVFKLDGGDAEAFQRVDRTRYSFDRLVAGLRSFPSSFAISTACVDSDEGGNLESLRNGFCDLVNSFPNANSVQLHNIALPVPLPGIRPLSEDDLLDLGRTIAARVRVPVEVLAHKNCGMR